MTEEKQVVYKARDGQSVMLSFETIKGFLVQGHSEYVTNQEMVYFMGICRSRGLNPFVKDCYLIKYSRDDSAAIVTSIDYFRKRAKAQADCEGWQKGVIVRRNGGVVYTDGLVLEGDTLLGGWAEAQPKGWRAPFRLEVNLRGYIKKTRDGKVTQFWKEENQPSQIAKVAESQLLRTLWPDEFQQLYTSDEIGEGGTFVQAQEIGAGSESAEELTKRIKGKGKVGKEREADELTEKVKGEKKGSKEKEESTPEVTPAEELTDLLVPCEMLGGEVNVKRCRENCDIADKCKEYQAWKERHPEEAKGQEAAR